MASRPGFRSSRFRLSAPPPMTDASWTAPPTSPPQRAVRQRAITEQLLLAALQRACVERAVEAGRRAIFLASTSRDLAMSLDERRAGRVRRCALPREGSWCIVDLCEPTARSSPARGAPRRGQASVGADVRRPLVAAAGRAPTGLTLRSRFDADEGASGGIAALRLWRTGGPAARGASRCWARSPSSRARRRAVVAGGYRAGRGARRPARSRSTTRGCIAKRKLRTVADEANRAKSAFLGNMSHELMTPLNAIGGYVTLIEMGIRGAVTGEQLTDLARIRHNQAHLLTLISEILISREREWAHGVPARRGLRQHGADRCCRDAQAVDGRQLTLVKSPHNVARSCGPTPTASGKSS